jgi:hypothetical protein
MINSKMIKTGIDFDRTVLTSFADDELICEGKSSSNVFDISIILTSCEENIE